MEQKTSADSSDPVTKPKRRPWYGSRVKTMSESELKVVRELSQLIIDLNPQARNLAAEMAKMKQQSSPSGAEPYLPAPSADTAGGNSGSTIRKILQKDFHRTLPPSVDPVARFRLAQFFERYCIYKLPSVAEVLRKYEGHEEALFSALSEQYGPEVPLLSMPSSNLSPFGSSLIHDAAARMGDVVLPQDVKNRFFRMRQKSNPEQEETPSSSVLQLKGGTFGDRTLSGVIHSKSGGDGLGCNQFLTCRQLMPESLTGISSSSYNPNSEKNSSSLSSSSSWEEINRFILAKMEFMLAPGWHVIESTRGDLYYRNDDGRRQWQRPIGM